jgi:hypothetical protein
MTTMTVDDLRPVALWAADCAERALPLYEVAVPGDHRTRDAIESARVFGNGQRRDKRMRTLAFAALAASGEIGDPGAKSAARAAQMAVAVAYTQLDLAGTAAARQTMHLLAPAAYAAQARELATGDPAAADSEIAWAVEHSTDAVRAVVMWMPVPEAGRTRLGDLYRALGAALRDRQTARLSPGNVQTAREKETDVARRHGHFTQTFRRRLLHHPKPQVFLKGVAA